VYNKRIKKDIIDIRNKIEVIKNVKYEFI